MDCSICCEKFNKSTLKPIKCGFCINFTACLCCVKRYLLETTQNAHCMNCKHEWSTIHLVENIPKVFINNEYKKRRQELMLERERSMMPATQPYVEIELDRKKIRLLTREIDHLRHDKYRIDTYSNEHLEVELNIVRKEHCIKCISYDIVQKQRVLDNTHNNKARAQFIRKCPIENCRGFLSTGWKCGICNTKVCAKCHEIKKRGTSLEDAIIEEKEDEQDEETKADILDPHHVCDPNNVETAKLLKMDTKACPKCAAMIFKIDGCDQMFCTQCHTGFSWNTGRIETKIIHNPHYFQYLREQANGREIARNPLDNPCAEILPDGEAFTPETVQYIIIQLNNIPSFNITKDDIKTMISIRKVFEKEMRVCNHIVANHYDMVVPINANRDLRVQYMMNQINEEKYKQILHMREKQNEKNREFEMIFRTYVTAARDIILNYVNLANKQQRDERKLEVYEELQTLRNYINECFAKLQPVFTCKVWQIIENTNSFEVSRKNI